MKKIISLLAATALTAAMSLPATAAVTLYATSLTGPQEAPPNTSPGIGAALVTVDDVARTLRIDSGFSGLIGETAAAHIHCCTADPGMGVAPIANPLPDFPLDVSSGSYSRTLDLSLASSYDPAYLTAHGGTPTTAFGSLLAGLNAGAAYFNIHTDTYPAGEIRGFLVPVPEPETYAMFAAALGLMAVVKRRRQTED